MTRWTRSPPTPYLTSLSAFRSQLNHRVEQLARTPERSYLARVTPTRDQTIRDVPVDAAGAPVPTDDPIIAATYAARSEPAGCVRDLRKPASPGNRHTTARLPRDAAGGPVRTSAQGWQLSVPDHSSPTNFRCCQVKLATS